VDHQLCGHLGATAHLELAVQAPQRLLHVARAIPSWSAISILFLPALRAAADGKLIGCAENRSIAVTGPRWEGRSFSFIVALMRRGSLYVAEALVQRRA
jgi:hypothetical protein